MDKQNNENNRGLTGDIVGEGQDDPVGAEFPGAADKSEMSTSARASNPSFNSPAAPVEELNDARSDPGDSEEDVRSDPGGGEADAAKVLQERVRQVEIELAERRPVEHLMRIFFYFIFTISAIVGFFGLKQLSDVRSLISSEVETQVESQFPKDKKAYLDYVELIRETEDLKARFQEVYGKYEVALQNFAKIGRVKEDFDIEGKVNKIMRESTERRDSGLHDDDEWRLNAIAVLSILAEAQKTRNFDNDFIFNAAQAASRLQQDELAYGLMKAAYEKRPNDSPVRAGMLSAVVDIGTQDEVEEAFSELMGMVVKLDFNTPHIVLAEAWNAAEDQRRYVDLIAALDQLIANKNAPMKPSFAYLLKAEALLRASRPGDVELAKQALAEGIEVLKTESAYSVWFDGTMRQYRKVVNALELNKMIETLESPF